MSEKAGDNTNMRVVILGGCGFIGRNLVEFLVNNNLVNELRVVDKTPPQLAFLNPKHSKAFEDPRVEYKSANLINPASCAAALDPGDSTPWDLVVNSAGETRVGQTEAVYAEGIVTLSCNVAHECARLHVKRLVEISSGHMYSSDKPHKEDGPIEPWSIEGRMKCRVEQKLNELAPELNYTIIRPAIVYGVGDRRSLTPRLLYGAIYKYLNETMKLLWTADLKVNTVHVSDVCQAIWTLGTLPEAAGQVYNVVDEANTTQGSLAEMVSQIFKIKHDYYGTAISTLAKTDLASVAEEANDKHLEAWAGICREHKLDHTPLEPSAGTDALKNKHLCLDGGKCAAVMEIKVKGPTEELLVEPHKEDGPIEPWSIEGRMKCRVEQKLNELAPELNYTIIRPAIVYGVGDRRSLTPRLLYGAIYKYLNETMKLLWTADLKVNTVHVSDVCQSIWTLGKLPEAAGQVYNVVDEANTTQGSLAEMVSQIFKIKHDYYGTAISTLAKTDLASVAEEANDKHLEAWAGICREHKLDHTPLEPSAGTDALKNKHLCLDGGKCAAVMEIKVKGPTEELLVEPHKEDGPIEPWSIEGRMKCRVEQKLNELAPELNYTIIRPAIVYGVGDRRSLTPRLLYGAIYKYLNETMKLLWTADLKVNTVHVSDVCQSIWTLGTLPEAAGQVYNVVDEANTTQGSLAEMVSQIFKIKHDYYGTAISTLAKTDLASVAEEANDKHLEAWAGICREHKLDHTPLEPSAGTDALKNKHLCLDGGKCAAVMEIKVKGPTEELLVEVLQDYAAMDLFPKEMLLV